MTGGAESTPPPLRGATAARPAAAGDQGSGRGGVSAGSRAEGGRDGAARGVRATGQAGLWNVANLLTMTRLVLVPGFVLLLVHGDGHDPVWRSFAWAAFAIAMITDLFDGELARRYGLVTDFGKIADPIADKAIMGAALVGLSALGDLPWWVTGVILFRELGITLMRFWVIRHGVIPASRGGKLKTLTQGVAVGMYILVLTGPLASIRAWIMVVAVVLTVATGVDYVRQAVVLRRAGLAAEAADRAEPAAVAESAVPGAAASVPAAADAPADAAAQAATPPSATVPSSAPSPLSATSTSPAAGSRTGTGSGGAHRMDGPTAEGPAAAPDAGSAQVTTSAPGSAPPSAPLSAPAPAAERERQQGV
ncbi:CDP-diacylglycerol--glycerol-3-phosphate 3-phosphatidyltransferase [Actinacidiphila yanglinensis]|uniref:CDP-diacylglycerol--glycerol-3-phosphate 3-phosphatidyltransferase n=1 Tax=Actinacidiphila yanglinensis TaxID=310779 RepID=A0A1H5WW97_9ACTN|nr:CDP-diacylglycerol--glycerol-3-phosphate 3-phosphatidyltransferase [Actinacidiphila yanglinensis]SEG03889.1 CDP-diacylglycerol--glycerol-3-phosphate 3-phosphatidyltransferase [Actinacidiphila yanglinensis]